MESGHLANGVQIWQVTAVAPSLEWQQEPTEWGPDTVAWRDDSTLVVTAGFGPYKPEARACYQVRLRHGVWSLITSP
jgi:hypothetical protein